MKCPLRTRGSFVVSLMGMVFLLTGILTPRAGAASSSELVVSPDGPFRTIQAALASAHSGDHIEVRAGTYPGPVVVDKTVVLQGIGFPIIDNGGQGTVVTLAAPDVVFRGFELRGSGSEPDRDHSGITITAPRVTAENNRIVDVLFGIFVSQAPDAVIRGNQVTSKTEYDIARKGDAIRLWYSPRAVVENNHIYGSRDLVIWYSTDARIRGNTIEHGRYGIHLMYCDGAQIENNRILDNSVGIYTMYSNNVVMSDNWIRGQRGPSGYALGFKDVENVEVARNVLVDNRGGIYMDGMPFSPGGYGRIHDNILAFNDVGVIILPAVRGNVFEKNTFWENVEQVAVQGGGDLGLNRWNGNTWSDYSGFDANGDGQGDIPYRAERFFEGLTDREPMLRALLYSPAQQALEFAGTAFPIVKSKPKFTDPTPSIAPNPVPASFIPRSGSAQMLAASAVALLALSGGIAMLSLQKKNRLTTAEQGNPNRPGPDPHSRQDSEPGSTGQNPVAVRVNQVIKRYGRTTALDGITFETQPGESIALWGPNGAGKTTLLKALLGLISFQGQIEIAGKDVRRFPKLARAHVGYVPQEAVFYDLTVQATMDFYARLKRADRARAMLLINRVGLGDHLHKLVPALSGGLKQRLALAIALLSDPPVLLLDEPTANLDSEARRDYLALLAGLHHEGKTIIFASHRIEEVESLADRVLVIKDGHLAETCTPEELRTQLAPQVQMTLWISDLERPRALARLKKDGFPVHLNGRGTVIVRVPTDRKLIPLQALRDEGIIVSDFQLEGISSWN